MLDKIDFLVRFWELRARHDHLGAPLDPSEQRELLSLLQLVTDDLRLPEPGPAPLSAAPACPAQAIGEGEVVAIDVRLVTAAGLLVTGARRLGAHAQVIVRATDAIAGVEYSLPCRVLWCHAGSPTTIALTVDGVPTRASFDTDDDTHTALAPHGRGFFGHGLVRPQRSVSASARRH